MIAALLGRHFWIPAYLALALGLWLPGGEFAWAKAVVPFSLGGILFFTCLRIPLAEVAGGLKDGPLLIRTGWMAGLKLIAIPAFTWGVTWFIAPAWAPGIALVSMMPAGLSSVALTDLHRGDRVQALFLILATSLLAPLTIPLAMSAVLIGQASHGQTGFAPVMPTPAQMAGQTVYILMLLAIPFCSAQCLRQIAPKLIARGMSWWGRLSILSLIVMVLLCGLGNRAAWNDWSPVRMLIPLALTCLATGISLGLALGLRRWLPGSTVTAFACAALYMNNGLAIAYATKFHPSQAEIILPCVLMQVPMVAAVVLWGRWTKAEPMAPVSA